MRVCAEEARPLLKGRNRRTLPRQIKAPGAQIADLVGVAPDLQRLITAPGPPLMPNIVGSPEAILRGRWLFGKFASFGPHVATLWSGSAHASYPEIPVHPKKRQSLVSKRTSTRKEAREKGPPPCLSICLRGAGAKYTRGAEFRRNLPHVAKYCLSRSPQLWKDSGENTATADGEKEKIGGLENVRSIPAIVGDFSGRPVSFYARRYTLRRCFTEA